MKTHHWQIIVYSASYRKGKPVDFGSLPGDRNARRCSVAAFRRRLQQLTSKYENPSLKIPLLCNLCHLTKKEQPQ